MEKEITKMARPDGLFERYVNPIFIETGTYIGDSVQEALDVGFERVYTIELDEARFKRCVERFADNPNVHLFQGDTLDILPKILELVDKRATFWLDAHITRGTVGKLKCPIVEEVKLISTHAIKNHTILMDDRRLLGSNRFGKVHEKDIIKAIKNLNPNYDISYEDGMSSRKKKMKDDIIVATVKGEEIC